MKLFRSTKKCCRFPNKEHHTPPDSHSRASLQRFFFHRLLLFSSLLLPLLLRYWNKIFPMCSFNGIGLLIRFCTPSNRYDSNYSSLSHCLSAQNNGTISECDENYFETISNTQSIQVKAFVYVMFFPLLRCLFASNAVVVVVCIFVRIIQGP